MRKAIFVICAQLILLTVASCTTYSPALENASRRKILANDQSIGFELLSSDSVVYAMKSGVVSTDVSLVYDNLLSFTIVSEDSSFVSYVGLHKVDVVKGENVMVGHPIGIARKSGCNEKYDLSVLLSRNQHFIQPIRIKRVRPRARF